MGVAVGSGGDVYVLEQDRITKLRSDGRFVTRWGSQGYLCVQYCSPHYRFNEPMALAVDRLGNVYVLETDGYRVQKSAQGDGAFLESVGDSGTGEGEFGTRPPGLFGEHNFGYGPTGLATDGDGNVYVADTWNHRIQKFTGDGAFVTAWGTRGSGNGPGSNAPTPIAMDAGGNITLATI